MSTAVGGDNLVAMESRITTNDMLGQTASAPNYGMAGYRNMMLAKQGQQQTLGQSRQRGSHQGGAAQNTFSQRSGAGVAGLTDTAANQIPAYTDYQDYGGVGASGVGTYGTANRRNQGFSGYGNYGNYGNMNRGLGFSSPRSLGGAGASGFGNYGAGNVGLGRNSGYGGSGGGYSPINVVSGYGPGVCEDRGLNPILVLATLAGSALAFFIIYRQVTGGGKRTINPTVNEFLEHISNLFWSGKWPLLSFLSPFKLVPRFRWRPL